MKSPARIARQSRAYVASMGKVLTAHRLCESARAAQDRLARRLGTTKTEALERALVFALTVPPEDLLGLALVRGRR